jgi:hypothetical protein
MSNAFTAETYAAVAITPAQAATLREKQFPKNEDQGVVDEFS